MPRRSSRTPDTIPLLRVRPDGEGRLTPVPKPVAGPQDPPPDDWWRAVMDDPRAERQPRTALERKREDQGFYLNFTLADVRLPVIPIVCDRCGLKKSFRTFDLVRQHGFSTNLLELQRVLAGCRLAPVLCRVKFAEAILAPPR